ncbi:MAG TPA: hypothetical protein VF041_23085 [Gemmatimonadaceae bacterium]
MSGIFWPEGTAPRAGLRDGTPWQAAAYAANWSDFGAGFATAQWRRDAAGRVWLKGLAKKAAALAIPDTILTLPAGRDVRPTTEHIFVVASFAGYAEVRVNPNGNVYLQAGGSATWTSLDGISFDPAG